jgi:DNA-binding CsgD family transcriptional regulator
VVKLLATFDHGNSVVYRYQVPYTRALAMAGAIDEAIAELDDLERQRNPSRQYLDNERQIARAWVAAAQGAVTEALSILSVEAQKARQHGQFAIEVLILQTATQFGDRSNGSRLHELAGIVEGPRAGLAARFADALQAGDGAELSAVSKRFDSVGDLIAAADASAWAAASYRRQGLRGSSLACSARAVALAHECGLASTPALRQGAGPSPFTDREREIVTLIGRGLSSRAVADRLSLSVRTVEGHIYRAMAKTETTTREELAALLAGSLPM